MKSSSKKQFNYLDQINFPNLSDHKDLLGRIPTTPHIRISQNNWKPLLAIRDIN